MYEVSDVLNTRKKRYDRKPNRGQFCVDCSFGFIVLGKFKWTTSGVLRSRLVFFEGKFVPNIKTIRVCT